MGRATDRLYRRGVADAAGRDEQGRGALEEETGIPPHLVERIAECPERLKYDLPPELRRSLWKGKWKGQLQDWYLCRFLGDDRDVNIATKHPEFNDWKWVEPALLPELIVPFKRDLYRDLLRHFGVHF